MNIHQRLARLEQVPSKGPDTLLVQYIEYSDGKSNLLGGYLQGNRLSSEQIAKLSPKPQLTVVIESIYDKVPSFRTTKL